MNNIRIVLQAFVFFSLLLCVEQREEYNDHSQNGAVMVLGDQSFESEILVDAQRVVASGRV